MNAAVWILVIIVMALLLLAGAAFIFTVIVEKKSGKPIGDLWVDPSETMPGEGIYTTLDEDPKTFMDGTNVMLTVRIVRK